MAHKKLVRPKCGCKLRDTGADVSFSHLGDGADVRLDACERVGRSQAVSYLQRLLQLKYTGHLAAVTLCLIESCSTNTATQPMTTTKSWRSGAVQSSMSRRCTACSCPSLPRFWAAW